MRIKSAYSSEEIGNVKSTSISEILKFLNSSEITERKDLYSLLEGIRKVLDANLKEFAKTLSQESGNTVSCCREEINAASRATSFGSGGITKSYHGEGEILSHYQTNKFESLERNIPKKKALNIVPDINPFYRFTECLISSLISGSRAVIAVPENAFLSVMEFWKKIEEFAGSYVLPAFISRKGKNFQKVIAAASTITGDTFNSHIVPEYIAKDARSYAFIAEDADYDEAARAIVANSLKGIRNSAFTPKRVLVMEEQAQYISNRITEESLLLNSGDPVSDSTDIASFTSLEEQEEFIRKFENEKENWAEPHTDLKRSNNSISPAILTCSESPGKLWNDGEAGPFIMIRKVKSLSEVAQILGSDMKATSLYLYSSDLNTTNYFESNTSLRYIFLNPYTEIGYEEMFGIENSLTELVRAESSRIKTVKWK